MPESNPAPNISKPALFAREFVASVVVFLVALPLCMGIAIASGVPPALGLVSGIIGGLVVGSFAGAPLQVSGPAAGLVVLCVDILADYGLVGLGVAVFGAGILQVVAAQLKFGQVFRATAPPVIKGMLAGIGIIIVASQLHVLIDDDPSGSAFANILAIPTAISKAFFSAESNLHRDAALIGILSLAVLIGWESLKPKKLRALPGALLAVIVGSAVAWFTNVDVRLVDIPSDLVGELQFLSLGSLQLLLEGKFIVEVITVAIIASAESLLCAAAVDQLHDGERADFDKELRAQGIGNIVAGLVGALPITGVIVRSSANVEAGGKTRWSAILHGLWLLILVVALGSVLSLIPLTSLAAVLVYVGVKLVNVKQFRAMWKRERYDAVVFATTTLIVVGDLLEGVIVGLALSIGRLVVRFSRIDVDIKDAGDRTDVHLSGAATFISIPQLLDRLENTPKGRELHVHLEHLAYIDHSAFEGLEQWSERYEAEGGNVVLEWDALKEQTSREIVFSASRTVDKQGETDEPTTA